MCGCRSRDGYVFFVDGLVFYGVGLRGWDWRWEVQYVRGAGLFRWLVGRGGGGGNSLV